MRRSLLLSIPFVLGGAGALTAQSIADRVNAVRDGVVRMSFSSRPGVCGDGMGSVWTRNARGDTWRACVSGPIRVAIGRDNGSTISVRTRVGGQWSASASETDLGQVSPEDAARYFLRLTRELSGGGRNANDAMTAAVFADAGDISPELAGLVRDRDVALETRKQALFWFGQGDAPTKTLVGLYDNLDAQSLREHFTFVVSQRRDNEAIDKLIDIARGDRDSDVRKQAMFWLGQTKDPRAIKFFHDILVP